MRLAQYAQVTREGSSYGDGARVALVTGAGEIVDGSANGGVFGNKSVIAGDDFAKAIRAATKDKDVKAILMRIDSPGGSVLASDQILDAVKKAQAAGKPVVVSMGQVAGFRRLLHLDLGQPHRRRTGHDHRLDRCADGQGQLRQDAGADRRQCRRDRRRQERAVRFTHRALYARSAGRPEPAGRRDLCRFQEEGGHRAASCRSPRSTQIAKGRVWSGADARKQGLVDTLGGFWTAVAEAKKLAKIPASTRVVFARYPRPHGFFDTLSALFGESEASMRAVTGLSTLANTPLARAAMEAVAASPHGGVELRATNLPLK